MPAAWVRLSEDVERVPGCLNTDLEILVNQGKPLAFATKNSEQINTISHP